LELVQYNDVGIVANYIEALRMDGQIQAARELGERTILGNGFDLKDSASRAALYYNLGILEMGQNNDLQAIRHLKKAAANKPLMLNAWQVCGDLLLKTSPEEAGILLEQSVLAIPDSYMLYFMLGAAYQHQNRLDDALVAYKKAEELNPDYYGTKGNIASVYQSLGQVEDALRYYEMALPYTVEDAGFYNNYGSLLGRQADIHVYTSSSNLYIHIYIYIYIYIVCTYFTFAALSLFFVL
jgi:tetratricopeptide (TPR) repeat protein